MIDAAGGDEGLLDLLYDTVGNPAAWTPFLDALGQTYGSGVCSVIVHDAKAGRESVNATNSVDPGPLEAYAEHYSKLNPWLRFASEAPVGVALSTEAMVPFGEYRKTEFYNDWGRRLNIDTGVVVTIQRDESRVMAVSALFSLRTLEHRPDPTIGLQRLAPHLLRVAQLNQKFAALEARAEAAEFAVDRLAMSMLVVDANRKVIYLTPQAQQLTTAADGFVIRHNMLDVATSSEGQILRKLIASALQPQRDLGTPPGGVMLVSRTSGERPYEVLVTSVTDLRCKLGFTGQLATIFVHDPGKLPNVPEEWLRSIYGLTRAEARLMQALLSGSSLNDAAADFGVGRETLRSQIKALFLKTGCRTQAELIRVGLQSLSVRYR